MMSVDHAGHCRHGVAREFAPDAPAEIQSERRKHGSQAVGVLFAAQLSKGLAKLALGRRIDRGVVGYPPKRLLRNVQLSRLRGCVKNLSRRRLKNSSDFWIGEGLLECVKKISF
jgi:hypothetical protein